MLDALTARHQALRTELREVVMVMDDYSPDGDRSGAAHCLLTEQLAAVVHATDAWMAEALALLARAPALGPAGGQ